jgi:small subunit ribosomal protein S17e
MLKRAFWPPMAGSMLLAMYIYMLNITHQGPCIEHRAATSDWMGNIRPTYIKRVAFELIARFPESFTEDFEANKLMVGRLTDTKYISLRNRVAGYITCRMRKKKV